MLSLPLLANELDPNGDGLELPLLRAELDPIGDGPEVEGVEEGDSFTEFNYA